MPDIEINPEFARALELIQAGQGNLFITGRAGTGKSTLLEYFRDHADDEPVILAPTGVAALNVRGQTLHRFFGFRTDVTPDAVRKSRGKPRNAQLYKELTTLIIDEASMLRADLLDCVDGFLRRHGPRPGTPFGGVQMVFVGDLYQLPPVVTSNEREIFKTIYETPYFFSAHVLKDVELEIVELRKVYRQKDRQFVELLNRIRNDTVDDSDLALLNSRVDEGLVYRLESSQSIQAIGIFGGCRDDDDSGDGVFPCGTFADVPDQAQEVDEGNGGTPDPDPVPDPNPNPMTVSSMIDYGPWNMRPGVDTPTDDTDDFPTAENSGMGQYIARIGGNNVNTEERFYLAGTPTPVQDMPDGVTATWTGTYEGIYRTAATGQAAWPDAFSSDSGTVSFEADFSDGPTYGNIEMTLTSRSADTLPGNDEPGFNSQHAQLGNSFTFAADDGNDINQFIGGKKTSHSEFSMRGGYFGTAAEKVGGVYEINYNAGINPRAAGPSMQGAGVFAADKDE